MQRKFFERGYLYKCRYVLDIENWEEEYCYLIADSFEEALELAKILYSEENERIVDIKKIQHKEEGKIYGCYMLAQNSL